MSLCWNIFSKVPWSCWYCECYLNDSFEFLRTTQLRNTVFCFSVIFIWKFFLGGAKKKDAKQQTALEWCHTIAAVFYFAGCKWHSFSWYAQSESWLLTVFLQRPLHKKKKPWNISGFDQKMKENYQTLLLRWCLFLWCYVIFHKSQNFDLTFHAHIVFAHLYGEILAPVKQKLS